MEGREWGSASVLVPFLLLEICSLYYFMWNSFSCKLLIFHLGIALEHGVGGEMCWVSRSSSPLPKMDFPSPGSPHHGFSLDIPDKRSPLCLYWADWELLAQIHELIQSWAARNTRGPGIIIYFIRTELIKF